MFSKKKRQLSRGICVCGVAESLHDLVPRAKCPVYCERATMDAHELHPAHDHMLSLELLCWEKSRKWYSRLWDRFLGKVYCFWCQRAVRCSVVSWNPIDPEGPALYATLTCPDCGHVVGPIETQFLVDTYKHIIGLKGEYRAALVRQRFEQISGVKSRC